MNKLSNLENSKIPLKILETDKKNESYDSLKLTPIGLLNNYVNKNHNELNIQKNEEKINDNNCLPENNSMVNISKLGQSKILLNKCNSSLNVMNSNLTKSNLNQSEFDINMSKTAKKFNISKLISDSITKKIVIMILIIFLLSPLTNEESYNDGTLNPYIFICNYVNDHYENKYPNLTYDIESNKNLTVNLTVDDEFSQILTNYSALHSNQPIYEIYFYTEKILNNYTINIDDYRVDEISYAFSKKGFSYIIYITRNEVRVVAIMSFLRSLFIVFFVWLMSTLFENDSKKIVLEPLEVMIDVVQKVARDPINSNNIENISENIAKSIKFLKISQKNDKNSKEKLDNLNTYIEVQVIQLAIIKISALLAISFGEAGGEIIKRNISSGTELNPIIKGKKKDAIFGFCDIRNFTDINQALEEKSLIFINEIAEIVHSAVDRFGGSTNKNIGDVFVMVWKRGNKVIKNNNMLVSDKENFDKSIGNFDQCNYIADQSVLGYLYAIQKINKSVSILNYNNNKDIQKRLGSDFKVSLGFGLHIGWGIEGAIGSFYKIDASYLSPNVNIAARLMAATKQYKVSILISGPLFDKLSKEIKSICRKIDIVTVKGSDLPLALYTIDVNYNPRQGKIKPKLSNKDKNAYLRLKKEEISRSYFKNNSFLKILSKKNFKEVLKTRRGKVFYETFSSGLESYISGNWLIAKEKFEDCLYIDETDGPTMTLLEYIKNRNYECPKDWKGYRKLTSK